MIAGGASTCHVFISRLWFLFVRVLCPSLAEAPIFPLMIYKSAKCTCSPDGGPAGRPPPWLLCRCARGGTSLHGHRCPGLSEERSGGSVAMVMLPKQAWHPSRLLPRLSWPAQAEALRPWGQGEVGEPQRSFLCAPQGRAGCRGQATQPPGVHCLDYLPLNREMRDREEASCSKTRQTCMPHGQTDGLRCNGWMLC